MRACFVPSWSGGEHRACVEFPLIERQAPENIHVEQILAAKPYECIDQ